MLVLALILCGTK